MTGEVLPSVSVVIITKGRHEMARAALDSVLATDYPADLREVIVLEETDTPEPFEAQGVRYHAMPMRNLGFGYARNRSVELSSHELIVFVDDDCIVEPSWLGALVHPLTVNDNAAAAGGAVLVPPCGVVGQCENVLGFPGGGLLYVHLSGGKITDRPTFSTCNAIVRRSAIIQVGGFDETLRNGGEDHALSIAIKQFARILYVPDARVYHKPRDNIRAVFQWFIRRGRAAATAIRRSPHQTRLVLEALRNSPLLRAAVLIVFLSLFRIPLFIGLTVAAAVYWGVTVFRYRWARVWYPSQPVLFVVPFVKLVMDLGMDIGQLLALLRCRSAQP